MYSFSPLFYLVPVLLGCAYYSNRGSLLPHWVFPTAATLMVSCVLLQYLRYWSVFMICLFIYHLVILSPVFLLRKHQGLGSRG